MAVNGVLPQHGEWGAFGLLQNVNSNVAKSRVTLGIMLKEVRAV
jgi:hypothetical protein